MGSVPSVPTLRIFQQPNYQGSYQDYRIGQYNFDPPINVGSLWIHPNIFATFYTPYGNSTIAGHNNIIRQESNTMLSGVTRIDVKMLSDAPPSIEVITQRENFTNNPNTNMIIWIVIIILIVIILLYLFRIF